MTIKIAGNHQTTPIRHLNKNDDTISDKKAITAKIFLSRNISQNSPSQNGKQEFTIVKQNAEI